MAITKFREEYAFLSNFYPCPITIDGIRYPTTEHAFQAQKSEQPNVRKAIAMAPSPGIAKRMGRTSTLRPDWEQVKLEVMRTCIYHKFNHPRLARMLLATGSQELVEGNYWHDNFWGNCTCMKCQNIEGQNHLGQILMARRGLINLI